MRNKIHRALTSQSNPNNLIHNLLQISRSIIKNHLVFYFLQIIQIIQIQKAIASFSPFFPAKDTRNLLEVLQDCAFPREHHLDQNGKEEYVLKTRHTSNNWNPPGTNPTVH